MPAIIHYAIEIETGTTYSDSTVGMSAGYMRLVTDRPTYDNVSTTPFGDNAFNEVTFGVTTIGTAFQSGTLYTASNGIFKTANTVPDVGIRYAITSGSADFTGGEMATAKGSGLAGGDMFEITNNTSGSESIKYVGVNLWYEDFITLTGLGNPSRRVDLTGTGDYGTLSGFSFKIDTAYIAGTDTPFWKTLNTNSVYLHNKIVRVYCVIDDVFYQIWTGVIDNNPYRETDMQINCKSNFKLIHKDFPPKVIDDTTFPSSVSDVKDEAVPVCFGEVEYARIYNVSGDPDFIDLTNRGKLAQASFYAEGDLGSDPSAAKINLQTVGLTFSASELQGKFLFVGNGGGSPDTDLGIKIVDNDATSAGVTSLYLSIPLENFDSTVHGRFGSADAIDRWNFKVATLSTDGVVSNENIVAYKGNVNGAFQLWEYSKEDSLYNDVRGSVSAFSTESGTYGTPGHATVSSSVTKPITKDGEIDYVFTLPIEVTSRSTLGGSSISGDSDNVTDGKRTTNVSVTNYAFGVGNQYTTGAAFFINLPIGLDNFDFTTLYFGMDVSQITPVSGQFILKAQFYDYYNVLVGTETMTFTPTVSGNFADPSFNCLPDEFYNNFVGGDTTGDTGSVFAGQDGTPTVRFADDLKIADNIVNALKVGALNRSVRVSFEFISSQKTEANYEIQVKQVGFHGVRAVDITGNNLYTRVSGEYLDDDSTESNTVYTAFRRILEDYDGIDVGKIDYGNLDTVRNDWYVGRQVTDRKNSMAYLKELANNSFVAIWQNRLGKTALSAWRERTDAATQHDQTSIIRDSISKYTLTGVDKIYTSFNLYFSENPGAKKFFKQYQIAGTDADSEPTDITPEELALWRVANAAYDIYNVVKEYKKDLPWFTDRTRWYNSGDTQVGTGIDSSAWKFLELAVYWLTREKRDVSYSLPITTGNITLELCDPIEFRDTIYTDAATDSSFNAGSIYKLEYDLKGSRIKVSSLIDPTDTIDDDFGDVVETGDAADTITELGDNTDTITEGV